MCCTSYVESLGLAYHQRAQPVSLKQALALMAISIEILSVVVSAKPSASEAGIAAASVLAFVAFAAGLFSMVLYELRVLARGSSFATSTLAACFVCGGVGAALVAFVCLIAATQHISASIVMLSLLFVAVVSVIVMVWMYRGA
jgi:predicted permease